MALEPIGDIADVSLTESTISIDFSRAQMLARVGFPHGTVASESGVSDSVAQAYVRRAGRSR
jgi:hypothetical protein